MKKKRIIVFMIIVTIFLCMITFLIIKLYESKMKEKDTFVIGMSQANLYEPWRIAMNKEISEEAKKHNNVKIIYKDAGGDSEKQKKDIQDLINFGANLLIVSINDSKELTPAVKKAYESIPVIVLDRAVEGYDYTLYIGSDAKSIGVQAGELVNELTGTSNMKIIEVQGMLNSITDEEITNGFKDSIGKNRNITIDRTIVGDWQKSETQDKIENILKDDTNINLIFAHSDYMALGAYYAAQNVGDKNIKIIGVDGLEGHENGIDLVKNGQIEGTFTCKTGGKEAVQYALKILKKKEEIPKKILLECNKITKKTLN